MNRNHDVALGVTRRHFFEECGVGVGKIALGMLLGESIQRGAFAGLAEPENPLTPRQPHFAAEGQAGDPSLHGRRAQPA